MSQIFHSQLDEAKFEPFESGVVQWLRRPGDSGNENLSAGIWKVTPEDQPDPVDVPVTRDETIYIVSGHLHVELEDGELLDLSAGSMASLSKGSKTRWTVLEPTVEFFVYS